MKFAHVRDAIRGKDRRIEELTEALEFIRLACEAWETYPGDHSEALEALEIIENKCAQALDKQ